MRIPSRFEEQVELATLTAYSKPHNDPEDLLPMCYRCSTYNPLIGEANNICAHCRQPFVHSFVSFEVLPLIEFYLEPDITDMEAMRLIQTPTENVVNEPEQEVDTLEIFENNPEQDLFLSKLTKMDVSKENPIQNLEKLQLLPDSNPLRRLVL